MQQVRLCYCVFFFNDTATTEIYTLSLHDALPICTPAFQEDRLKLAKSQILQGMERRNDSTSRSEEHTSELQSRQYLVCRLLLEKKKKHPTQLLCRVPMLHASAHSHKAH